MYKQSALAGYTQGHSRPCEEPFGKPCTRPGCHMNGSAVGCLVGV